MAPPFVPGASGATAVTLAAFWSGFSLWIASELWTQWRRRSPAATKGHDRGSMVALAVSVWASVALAATVAIVDSGGAIASGRSVAFWLGVVLMLAGIGLRWSAILALGSAFTVKVVSPAGDVIRRGPYRWVRHPSYTGSLLTILGIVLCCVNFMSLLAIALPIAAYAYRIRVEEDFLVERWGESYRLYMGHTKRLVPFLL